MTNIDRALRTLARLQNAAPSLAASRIDEVTQLLLQMHEENEYLSARLTENLHSPAQPPTAGRAAVPPINPTDTSIEELFGVDSNAAVDLFANLDAALFTNEMPAVPTGVASSHGDEEADGLPDVEALLAQVNNLLKPSLTSMRGELESLIEGRAGRLTSNQSDTLRSVSENTGSLLTLIDSLELIDQLRHHSLPLRPTSFNPIELLDTVEQMVRERAITHDHQLSVQADHSLPFVRADFERSLVILSDLVDNAIRYTPDDGMIRVSADNLGTHVLFTVADNGIGLSPDDLEHIGKPFWRALHEPMVRDYNGTGLRLFLAQQMLALQGGEMFFSGEPGFGSSFSFTLPVASAASS